MFKVFLFTLVLAGLTFADGPILKTGQIKSYDGGGNVVTDGSVRDDGYYQTGVVRSYGRNGDIVIDNATGLEWEDNESIQIKWEDSGSFPAKEYCDAFDLGGHMDWRLPSIYELLTLVDTSQTPSTTKEVFNHIYPNSYWTSTTDKDYVGNVWIVSFGSGYSGHISKDNDSYVRCVRSGQLEASNFDRNDTTDIVTDASTQLHWQDNSEATTVEVNWTVAIDYCENTLDLGGFTDWRLPNRNELLSIIDYNQSYPAIYLEFVNKFSDYYWSSTADASHGSDVWVVNFNYGHSGSYYKGGSTYVRCVRGGKVQTSTFNPSIIMYLLN